MVLETWVRRGGRDFGSGGPMGVQETSAMEVIFDWRLEKNPEDSELANMAANDTKMVAKLTLPPRFRKVLI
ncbi:hypothetical protein TNCV_1526461 [Trichonephila clavipes]|nr:hypothetical protein TNCV_1526461 [Trichonephila clavipes]